MSADRPSPDLTRLLREWRDGRSAARDELWSIVYDQLKKLAHHILLDRRPRGGLQTTALVHELYLRLIGQQELDWNDRGHFFAIAARAMRFILVDRARRRRAAKRGGGRAFEPFDEAIRLPVELDVDLVALDDALDDLGRRDPRKSQVVELSYFAGLTYDEIGRTLGVSPATVKRDLRSAKMWLLRELRRGERPRPLPVQSLADAP